MAKARKKKSKAQQEEKTPVEKASPEETPATETPEETVEFWKDKCIRAQADLQNIRRRMMEDTEDRVRMRLEALLNDLIRVSDYMEAALGNIPEAVKKAKQADAFLAGIHAIQQALEAVMLGHGMTFLAPEENHEFDPIEHEAVEKVVDQNLKKPRLELLSRGYRIGKRILRPAKLRIIGPEPTEDPPEGQPGE